MLSIDGVQAVTVTDPGLFQSGDTVLLIQMKGMAMLIDPPEDYGKQQDINHAGNYEFLLVDEVSNNTVIFTREFLKNYNADENVQLVKVKGYQSARVTGTLSAKPWNGETGGVLAIIVTNTLKLDADIDVSASGFRGGAATVRPAGQCAMEQPDEYSKFSFPAGTNNAGAKGEGPVTWYLEDESFYPVNNDFIFGRGRLGTGGGGGNGRFAGGGGGSNFGQAGMGGGESESCPEFSIDGQSTGGIGGYRLEDQLLDLQGNFINRFFPGGGGGGSTGETDKPGTDGGTGGGLAIIIANHIEGNGEYGIYANGESIEAISGAGAGGGGGGGTIVSSTDNYHGTLNWFARGGTGGNVDNTYKAGPGGGGGGGTIIHSGISLPSLVNVAVDQGASGTNIQQNDPHGTTIATGGGVVGELEISLNGLLFNGIRTARTVICEDTAPDMFEGTRPRGGKPHYIYSWSKRVQGAEWVIIPGAASQNYQPGVLVQDTEFIRIVTDQDDDPVIDTSNLITITVQPKIVGNLISGEQIICEGELPLPVTGDQPVQGGTGIFEYTWNRYTETDGEWMTADGESNRQTYNPPALYDSTLFIRIATSGVCIDTSNLIAVDVHPRITNNLLDDAQAVCHGNLPLPVTGPEKVGGGLGPGSYVYAWELRANGGWNLVSGENEAVISPEDLIETTFFRRTVQSGVCSDISNEHQIEALPLIYGNVISDNQTICYKDQPDLFTGSDPSGGDGIYRYAWKVSTDEFLWTAPGQGNQDRDFHSSALSDTSWFRRIVYSGHNDACIDTSNTVLIEFHPVSHARIIEGQDIICNGEQVEISFALGGDGPPYDWNIVFTDGMQDYTTGSIGEDYHVMAVSPVTSDSAIYIYNIVSLSDKFGCMAPSENLTGTAEIRVYAYPDPDPGAGGEVCGPVYELNAPAGLGNILWESESVPADFSNPAGRSTRVTVTEYGTHNFKFTRTNWQCPASATVSVTFHEQPSQVNAGENQLLRFKFDTYLDASLPGHIPSAWGLWELVEGAGTIAFPDDPGSIVSGMGFGNNVLQWTVYNGVCEPVSGNVTITVMDLHTPNAFSPNNSGYNDRFVIGGIENSELNELTVFNRQGNIVYRSVNYANDWDGRNYNGDPLPEDTYYYILNVDNNYSYKGFIILKR